MRTILTTFKALMLLIFLYSCGGDDDQSPMPEMSGALLLSPTKDQVCEQGVNTVGDSSRLIFEWEKDENATSYDLVVNDIESGENFIVYKEIYTTSKELELVHNRAYQWYVISRNTSKEEVESQKWNFYFVGEPKNNYTPFPSKLLEPSFGQAITSSDGVVDFLWSATDPDGDTLIYDLYLDEIDGMQEPSDTLKNLEGSSISVQLESGKTYFWRVKASDGSNSSYSQVYSFKIN